MQPEQQPAAPTSEPTVSGKLVAYFLLFVVLVFLLYVFPEFLVFKQYGFAPHDTLANTGPDTSLGGVLASLWRDRGRVLNPMNNPLVRFFLVTIVVGVVYDKMKQYSAS
jgi:hypothetical protein